MSTTNLVEARIDVHLTEADLDAALRRDVCEGLLSSPKELPPKWLYDEHGSELFDAITRLDEYYPTEAERQVLLQRADEIIDRVDAETIVELGSGTSDKTTALLERSSPAREAAPVHPVRRE